MMMHDDCPACEIEAETGETAPPRAHGWCRPSDDEMRVIAQQMEKWHTTLDWLAER